MSSKRSVCPTFVLCSLLFAASAFSQTSPSGEVRGTDGRPIVRAEVRLQREDAKAAPVAVKTDAKGRFVAGNLPSGRYAVTANASGLSSSRQIVTISSSKPQTVSLRVAAAVSDMTGPVKKKKRVVWVPATTGSRIGGNYVEVEDSADDSSTKRDSAALQRIQSTQANALSRSASGGTP